MHSERKAPEQPKLLQEYSTGPLTLSSSGRKLADKVESSLKKIANKTKFLSKKPKFPTKTDIIRELFRKIPELNDYSFSLSQLAKQREMWVHSINKTSKPYAKFANPEARKVLITYTNLLLNTFIKSELNRTDLKELFDNLAKYKNIIEKIQSPAPHWINDLLSFLAMATNPENYILNFMHKRSYGYAVRFIDPRNDDFQRLQINKEKFLLSTIKRIFFQLGKVKIDARSSQAQVENVIALRIYASISALQQLEESNLLDMLELIKNGIQRIKARETTFSGEFSESLKLLDIPADQLASCEQAKLISDSDPSYQKIDDSFQRGNPHHLQKRSTHFKLDQIKQKSIRDLYADQYYKVRDLNNLSHEEIYFHAYIATVLNKITYMPKDTEKGNVFDCAVKAAKADSEGLTPEKIKMLSHELKSELEYAAQLSFHKWNFLNHKIEQLKQIKNKEREEEKKVDAAKKDTDGLASVHEEDKKASLKANFIAGYKKLMITHHKKLKVKFNGNLKEFESKEIDKGFLTKLKKEPEDAYKLLDELNHYKKEDELPAALRTFIPIPVLGPKDSDSESSLRTRYSSSEKSPLDVDTDGTQQQHSGSDDELKENKLSDSRMAESPVSPPQTFFSRFGRLSARRPQTGAHIPTVRSPDVITHSQLRQLPSPLELSPSLDTYRAPNRKQKVLYQCTSSMRPEKGDTTPIPTVDSVRDIKSEDTVTFSLPGAPDDARVTEEIVYTTSSLTVAAAKLIHSQRSALQKDPLSIPKTTRLPALEIKNDGRKTALSRPNPRTIYGELYTSRIQERLPFSGHQSVPQSEDNTPRPKMKNSHDLDDSDLNESQTVDDGTSYLTGVTSVVSTPSIAKDYQSLFSASQCSVAPEADRVTAMTEKGVPYFVPASRYSA